MEPKLDPEIGRLLKTVADHFDQEDRVVRERQLRRCRRLKLYWNSFSQIYWSDVARDYRIYGDNEDVNDDQYQSYYDKPINVFRAFLETIIAALSIQIPGVVCAPDDANNPNDLATANAGDKAAELIYKHNDVIFLWLYALYVYCTEGLVAVYTYEAEDKKYGTYQDKKYKNESKDAFVCAECGQEVPDDVMDTQEKFEFAPDDDDIALHSELNQDKLVCPNCSAALDPELQKSKLVIPRFIGMTDKPKSRVCFTVVGTLYVKVANYAKDQKATPYLIYSHETHYTEALHCWPHLRANLPQGGWSNTGTNDPYEQQARLNPQYENGFPEENVTIRKTWLRPSSFDILPEDDARLLKRKFPDGARVTLVNDITAEYANESLDDCWTLSRDPLSDYLNHDPLGELLTNIQDITNDLISLTLQTIEHGIEQTWADPAVVNFDAQQQIEASPGYVTPTKPQGGSGNISQAFFSTKAASLSPEVFQFYQIVQQLGQFVSAAMPSIFGGSQESGSSRTASEYAMSRTASLQRLQTPWRMMTLLWKDCFGKAIPTFFKIVQRQGDERIVKKDELGEWYNVFIRKEEVVGKLGSVELEGADKIPISDQQKADMVMRLMELNNMEIMKALVSPENLPFIKNVVGIPEFQMPGEADRQKQYEEIQLLLNEQPEILPADPIQNFMSMQTTGEPAKPIELPSIEPDPDVDNHQVEAQICRNWLVSDAGRLAKMENPDGYKNVLLHMKMHLKILAQSLSAQMGQPQQTPNNGNRPAKPPQKNEISEGSDVRTPVQ